MSTPFKMKRTVKTFDFGSKKAKNKRNYNKANDYNTDKYDQSATQSKFTFKAQPEKDFSMHNISARKTEGTIEQQAKRRAARSENPVKMKNKRKKGESSLDYNRRVKGVNRGSRPGNYKGPKTPQVGKTVKGSRKKIV